MDTDSKGTFFTQIPKIELHAHLNGSLSLKCLRELGCLHDDFLAFQSLYRSRSEKNLDDCFALFKIAHNATSSKEAVVAATKTVIEEFQHDNVVYLELRTTPRAEENMTKIEYVESVVKGIQESKSGIITKLLLSIDRCHDLKTSQESLELIIKMKERYPDLVKGVDLCGNPQLGAFHSDLFRQARDAGLFITLHCGEVKNDTEVREMLHFGPDRIGHGTFVHPQYGGSEECWRLYQQKKIPLECCLTSNVLCRTSKSYKEHHVQAWIKESLPFSLCTDDKGVFGTCVSQELKLASENLNLSHEDIWKITFDSVDHSFASDEEKSALKQTLLDWKLKNNL